MSKVVQYMSLDYEDYKNLEKQMVEFGETVHTSTGGFYHKSIRLRIGDGLVVEYHGPIVKAAEDQHEDKKIKENGDVYACLEQSELDL